MKKDTYKLLLFFAAFLGFGLLLQHILERRCGGPWNADLLRCENQAVDSSHP